MKNKLITLVVVTLVLLNVGSFISSLDASRKITVIDETLASLPKDPIVYVGKDGYTPKLGLDYFNGRDGSDGINSVSFSTTEIIVKEVPLIGQSAYDIWLDQGNSGTQEDFIDSLKVSQDIRVNDETKDIETRLSTQRFWKVMVYCADYRLVCPDAN